MRSVGEILGRFTYAQKLGSEEWKTFAAGMRRAKGNACEVCKRGNLELQVHHIFYDQSREPWEYQSQEVVVMCKGCHDAMHEQLRKFRAFVFGKMTPQAFKVLNGALAVAFDAWDPLRFAHALAEFVSTPSLVDRYAEAYKISAKEYDPEDEMNKARADLQNADFNLRKP